MDKSGLQNQPLTILQQIEELKNWHKQQQLKLNFDGVGTIESKDQNVEIKTNEIKPTAKSIMTQQVFDEMPIKVASPSLKTVGNLSTCNEQEKTNLNTKKPHKFLKKGEGIARFGMGPRKIPRIKSKNNRVLCLTSSSPNVNDETKHCSTSGQKQTIPYSHQLFNKEDVSPLEPPDVRLGLKNWKDILKSGKAEEILEKAIFDNQLELFQPDSSFNSSTASNLEKFLAVAKKWKDKQELQAFESMEQHVLESSFCSSSSFVMKVMKDAIISTPTKESLHSTNKMESTSSHLPPALSNIQLQKPVVDDNSKQLMPDLPTWTDPISAKDFNFKVQRQDIQKDLEESLHVRFADYVDYKSFIEYSQSLSNSNQIDHHTNVQINENEEWQENSGEVSVCSSGCEHSTTYSSSDEDARVISPPGRPPLSLQNQFTNNTNQKSSIERLETTDLGRKELQNKEENLITKDCLLEKKVKELEEEIEAFRKKNKELESVQESLEKERKKLQQQKNKFLKEFEDEKKAITAQMEEEKKKFNKEKLVFEKYSKTLIKNPSKEERKVIQSLREQLSELKEELNKKESRWGAAQARVRNQVKHLEEDNKKLRAEVEVLRKQARYLEFLTQKQKVKQPNNTKLIHAISEHISNNPLEDNNPKRNFVNGNYFSSRDNLVKTVLVEVDPGNLGNVRIIKEVGQELKPSNSNNPLEQVYHQEVGKENFQAVRKISPYEEIKQLPKIPASNPNNTNDPLKAQNLQNTKEISINSQVEQKFNLPSEILHEDGTREIVFPDGKKEIKYKNGNLKKIDPLNGSEKTIYFNGDVKEIKQDGTSKYYFSESRIWQTTLPDGLELLDFPNGQVEKRHTNGLVETIYPNGCQKIKYPNGSEEVYYGDGTKLKIEADKTQILFLQNGQKEIHTDQYMRREYPDGTMKTVYPDGATETVYANGRVRLKDKDGNLVMDSAASSNRQ